MSKKFCLKWNDFQPNWIRSLGELRNDTEFTDVTLISDDKVKFSAHKILLSSCSSMFRFILTENSHSIPLMYLGGVSSENLQYLLDYIYHGEVNIYQEQLDSFLHCAQKLEIEGLTEVINANITEGSNNETLVTETMTEQFYDQHYIAKAKEENPLVKTEVNRVKLNKQNNRDVSKIDVSTMTSEEINIKMNELYQRIEGVYYCMACEYSSKFKHHMKMHVEIHLDGLSYFCNKCSKEFRYVCKNKIYFYFERVLINHDFRTKNGLTAHNSAVHTLAL